ncbi:MAG: MoaD/ThiS family protein [Pseudomonadota bacterium]|nr:MoaD/ThiS family protein [Pseudomonadota bacterium]MEE3288484.1 MoaD/ThiS family protein [Pseudomonadota bacterium]
MKITFKLYAGLAKYLPDGSHHNAIDVELDRQKSISEIISRFDVPPEQAHLVLVNGVFCGVPDRDSHLLEDGDTLAIWPPVAGG